MPQERDLLQEQRATEAEQVRLGRDLRPDELQGVLSTIYGTDMPPELANAGTPSTLANQSNAPGAALPGLKGQLDTATNQMNKFDAPQSTLNVFQQAIRTKNKSAQTPLGESELFKQAGVGGWGALSASLSTRKAELDNNFSNYQNMVNNFSGLYRDAGNRALKEYNIASQNYTNEVARLDRSNEILQQNEQAIKLIDHQAQINDTAANNEILRDSGLWDFSKNEPLDEQFTSLSGNTYNKMGYAEDPNWTFKINNRLNEIGKLKSLEDVDAYINKSNPSSKITSKEISAASEKYDIGWEELTALIAHEATAKGGGGFASSNVFKNNNNPAGITWTTSFPESMKGTARPEGGNYVKFATVQDGVNSVAYELNKRKAPKRQTKSNKQIVNGPMAFGFLNTIASKLESGNLEWDSIKEDFSQFIEQDVKKDPTGIGEDTISYKVKGFTENQWEDMVGNLNSMDLSSYTKEIEEAEQEQTDEYIEGNVYEVGGQQYEYVGNGNFEVYNQDGKAVVQEEPEPEVKQDLSIQIEREIKNLSDNYSELSDNEVRILLRDKGYTDEEIKNSSIGGFPYQKLDEFKGNVLKSITDKIKEKFKYNKNFREESKKGKIE